MKKLKKLGFAATMARAGCVVEVRYLYPHCSQYYAQQYCPKQFALKCPEAKVILSPKLLPLRGGANRNGMSPGEQKWNQVYLAVRKVITRGQAKGAKGHAKGIFRLFAFARNNFSPISIRTTLSWSFIIF